MWCIHPAEHHSAIRKNDNLVYVTTRAFTWNVQRTNPDRKQIRQGLGGWGVWLLMRVRSFSGGNECSRRSGDCCMALRTDLTAHFEQANCTVYELQLKKEGKRQKGMKSIQTQRDWTRRTSTTAAPETKIEQRKRAEMKNQWLKKISDVKQDLKLHLERRHHIPSMLTKNDQQLGTSLNFDGNTHTV